jgi:hypothetical protein
MPDDTPEAVADLVFGAVRLYGLHLEEENLRTELTLIMRRLNPAAITTALACFFVANAHLVSAVEELGGPEAVDEVLAEAQQGWVEAEQLNATFDRLMAGES